jgi:hypothetical protein
LYRRALASQERVLGPEHADTVLTMINLAVLLDSKGNFGEADALNRRVAAIKGSAPLVAAIVAYPQVPWSKQKNMRMAMIALGALAVLAIVLIAWMLLR